MGYHRILRFVSTEPIQLECPDCGGEVEVWPNYNDAECNDCGAEFGVTRTDGAAALDDSVIDGDGDWQPPPRLYHGTSLIRFKGMLAKPETFELYLAGDPEGTGMYAEDAAAIDDSVPVTVAFDTQKLLSLGKLMPDWDDVDTMISNGETDAEGNPLFGSADSAKEVTWQDSLRLINTSSYEGPVLGAILEADIDGRIEKPPFGKLSARMPPAKLYHGTFGWNSDAISEGGIAPGLNPNWGLSDSQYVYLTETPELAANWVREAYESGDIKLDWDRATAAVFEVDTADLAAEVERDPKGGHADWRHKGTIPADAVRLVYEADYTDNTPDPDEYGWRGASRWWRAAESIGEMDREPTISFDFDDVLHYAPGGDPIDFWTPESYVPRGPYVAELRRLSAGGHRVIVVSHRDPGMEHVVYGFARMHDLDIDGVFCVGVRGSKRRVLENEGAAVHYDDSPYVESELRESGVKLAKVPRTAINDLTWVPDNMWDEFPEIYRAYAERVGVIPPP